MGSRTVRYGTREDMYGGVERLSDEGWILSRLKKLPGGVLEATFANRPSMVAPSPGQMVGGLDGGYTGPRAS